MFKRAGLTGGKEEGAPDQFTGRALKAVCQRRKFASLCHAIFAPQATERLRVRIAAPVLWIDYDNFRIMRFFP
jgi:hypothetical protein